MLSEYALRLIFAALVKRAAKISTINERANLFYKKLVCRGSKPKYGERIRRQHGVGQRYFYLFDFRIFVVGTTGKLLGLSLCGRDTEGCKVYVGMSLDGQRVNRLAGT